MSSELKGMKAAMSLVKDALKEEQTQEQNVKQISELEDGVYPLSKEELEQSKDSIYYAEGLMNDLIQELQNED